MVVEIAQIDVIPGQEEAFAGAYQQARHLLTASDGCISARMTRGVESPSRFVGIVQWESVDDHLANFLETDRYQQYRDLIGRYLVAPPAVEHFIDIGVRSF